MNDSSPAWQVFAALQREADPHLIDRSSARDKALDTVLDEVLAVSTPDWDLVRKRFYSLCRNRLSKYNNRRAIDRGRCRASQRRGGADFGNVPLTAAAGDAFDKVAYRQLTDLIRTVLQEEEFQLLLEMAEGQSYADTAHDLRITVPSLKSKAFRIRQKVRHSPIAADLRCWTRR